MLTFAGCVGNKPEQRVDANRHFFAAWISELF